MPCLLLFLVPAAKTSKKALFMPCDQGDITLVICVPPREQGGFVLAMCFPPHNVSSAQVLTASRSGW